MTARAEPRPWFRFDKPQAKAGAKPAVADLYIFDELSWWGTSAKDFVAELTGLSDVERIDLHLNSPGGDVFDAIAIKNALAAHPAPVRVIVEGLAASSASFLAMAGDEVLMAPNSELMIHDAWGIVVGPAAEMRRSADLLDRASDSIASIYAAKAGGTTADWRKAMQPETWYSAEEAVEAGLADGLTAVQDSAEVERAKARFDLSIYNHAGRSDAPAPRLHALRTPPAELPGPPTQPKGQVDPMTDLITGLRERLGIAADADLTDDELLAAVDEALAESEPAPQAKATALPSGVVAVEQSTLDELRVQARLGAQAREQQLADERMRIVDSAVTDGRIAPSRRDHWLNALKADPGAAETLAGLAPGLVVNTAPAGYTGRVDEPTSDDSLYALLYGKES